MVPLEKNREFLEIARLAASSFASVADVRLYEEYTVLRERPTTKMYAALAGLDDYFFVKIGISADPENRIIGLQTSNPAAVSLMGHVSATPAYERKVHRRLREYWERGEWFRYEGKAKRVAKAIASGNLNRVANIIG